MKYPVLSTCVSEFVGRTAAGHQPLAPVYGLPVVDRFTRFQQNVQQLVEVLLAAAAVPAVQAWVAAFSEDVRGCAAFTLIHEYLRRSAGSRSHVDKRALPLSWKRTTSSSVVVVVVVAILAPGGTISQA